MQGVTETVTVVWSLPPCNTAFVLGGDMKTATKVMIVLLVGGVALVAAQEGPRTYVADCLCGVANCVCSLCSYLFGQ